VDLDPDGAVLAQHADAAMAVEVALDEAVDALDLARSVGGVAGEDVARDRGAAFHLCRL
jgi:hypothetical protein